MKFFGQYLVEKGVITEELLVRALIAQTKALPTLAEAALEKKLLTSTDIYELFKIQSQESVGFMEAAQIAGVWSEKQQGQLEECLAKARVPLGQVLVQMGARLEDIMRALDEFLSKVDSLSVEPAIVSDPNANNQPAIIPALGADFGPFCVLFSLELHYSLNSIFLVDPSTNILNGALRKAQEDVQYLIGAAKRVNANQFEILLTQMEKVFKELLQRNVSNLDVEFRNRIQATGKSVFDFLWETQPKLAPLKNEEELFKDAQVVQGFQELGGSVEAMILELGKLELAKDQSHWNLSIEDLLEEQEKAD